jgi:sulfite reductase beta subunit-like hemoprotein
MTLTSKSVIAEVDETIAQRQGTHGDYRRNLGQIAKFWSAYLEKDIKAQDVCSLMMLAKISRSAVGKPAREHWLDIAGYAELARRLSTTVSPDKSLD